MTDVQVIEVEVVPTPAIIQVDVESDDLSVIQVELGGPQGPKGDTGATGAQGPKGDPGDDGADGVSSVAAVRTITSGSATFNANADDHIVVQKTVGAATTVTLCAAADRTVGRAIKVVDGLGDADTHNITLVPDPGDLILGGTSYVIDFSYGSVTLWPLEDGTGWYS